MGTRKAVKVCQMIRTSHPRISHNPDRKHNRNDRKRGRCTSRQNEKVGHRMAADHGQEWVNRQDVSHAEINSGTHAYKHDGHRKHHSEVLLPNTSSETSHDYEDATACKNEKTDRRLDPDDDWEKVPPAGVTKLSKQVRVATICIVRSHFIDSDNQLTERNRNLNSFLSKCPKKRLISKRAVNFLGRNAMSR